MDRGLSAARALTFHVLRLKESFGNQQSPDVALVFSLGDKSLKQISGMSYYRAVAVY